MSHRIGYMDKIDYDHELGNAAKGSIVYPSIESLRENKHCVAECGIVKVKVELLEVVDETKTFHKVPGKRQCISRIGDGPRTETIGTWGNDGKFIPDDPQPEPKPILNVKGTFNDISPDDENTLITLAEKYGLKYNKTFRKL